MHGIYLCAEVEVQVSVHGDRELPDVHKVWRGGVRDVGCVVVGEGVELVHHIRTGKVNCREMVMYYMCIIHVHACTIFMHHMCIVLYIHVCTYITCVLCCIYMYVHTSHVYCAVYTCTYMNIVDVLGLVLPDT